MLEILEQRHDWAKFNLNLEHFKYVLTRLVPDVIMHSQNQDEEQIRDNYDSMSTRVLVLSTPL